MFKKVDHMLAEVQKDFLYENIFRKLLGTFSDITGSQNILLYVKDSNVQGLKPLIGIGKYSSFHFEEKENEFYEEKLSHSIQINFSGTLIGAVFVQGDFEFIEHEHPALMLTVTLFLNSFVMYREANTKMNRMGALYEVAKFTDYLVNPSNALYSIIEIVKSIVNYDSCGIYIFHRNELKLKYFHGIVPDTVITSKCDFYDNVINKKRSVLSHLDRFKSYILIPLITTDKVIGAVSVGSLRTYEYNYDDSVALQIVCTQLSSMEIIFNSLLSVKSVTNNIVNSINQGIITIDLDKKINLFNTYSKEVFQKLNKNEPQKIENVFEQGDPIREALENTLDKGTILDKKREKINNTIFELNTFILKNDSQYVAGAGVNFRDITEEIKLEDKLKFKDRITTIGELSASISHEIKNPLAGIKMVSQLLKDDLCEEDRNSREYVNVILEEVDRLDKLVNELLNFGKHSNQVFEFFSFYDVLNSVIFLLHKDIGKSGIKIEKRLDEMLPLYYGDPMQFKQLFLNVLKNSVNALRAVEKDNKTIIIKIAYQDDVFNLFIKDNGRGISKEKLEKVFELFFTSGTDGTGLGLPIVEKIIKAHNGDINIESTENEYTEIKITLPHLRKSC